MKAVLQRAKGARVEVAGEVVGEFSGEGIVALVGVHKEDTEADAQTVARKISQLRILDGERSVIEAGAPVMVISQFTLYGRTKKGRRPSWSDAAGSEVAKPLVDRVIELLRGDGVVVSTGVFGAMMDVSLTNSGPFTVIVDTRN